MFYEKNNFTSEDNKFRILNSLRTNKNINNYLPAVNL